MGIMWVKPTEEVYLQAISTRAIGELSYAETLDRFELSSAQLTRAVMRRLPDLAKQAINGEAVVLETLISDPKERERFFRMEKSYIEDQCRRINGEILGETQARYYDGTYFNHLNVDDIFYYVLTSNHKRLASENDEEAIQELKTICTEHKNLKQYLHSLGLKGPMGRGLNKGEQDSPLAVFKSYDRARQRYTGNPCLFELSEKVHIHEWDPIFKSPNSYWRVDGEMNKDNVKRVVLHAITEALQVANPNLKINNQIEVTEGIGHFPTYLARYFHSLDLAGLMKHAFDKMDRDSPLAVLEIFDEAYQEEKGHASLFDQNQPVYLNKESISSRHNDKPRVLRNRLYHPQCANNGTLITLEDFAQEVRAVEASGASLFLGSILSVAARTGQTPQLLLDARDAFPDMCWDKLMEVCGINYEAHIPSDPETYESKTTAFKRLGGLTDNIISSVTPSFTFLFDKEDKCLTQRITDEEQEKHAELLAPDFKPTKTTDYLNSQITYGGRNRQAYYAETKSIDLLKREQEVTLAKDIMYFELKARQAFQNTDMTTFYEYTALRAGAINHFVEHNLRLVLHKARRSYAGKGVPFDELREAGNAILRRAVVKFDYTKGYKFSTYADAWLRNVMGGLVKHYNASVAVQYSVREMQRRIQLETQRYIGETSGKHPSTSKLSEITGLTTDQIEEARQARPYASSLQERIWGDDSSERMELIEDTTAVDSVEVSHVSRALDRIETLVESCSLLEPGHPYYLTPREELIVRYRIGGETTYAETGLGRGFTAKNITEVGNILGVTRSRVGQIQGKILEKFRRAMVLDGVIEASEETIEKYKTPVRLFRKEQAAKRKKAAAARTKQAQIHEPDIMAA